MIKQGKFADYLNADYEDDNEENVEDVTEEHTLDPDDLLEPASRPEDDIEQTSEFQ
jgi:hypothetical protein